MAQKRMFSKDITESDAFTDMPLSSQALYLHLGMSADDDGFINNPKRVSRCIGASEDDLKILASKGFIIPFESGVIVIKHWRINNSIKSDRYRRTNYQEEFSRLHVNENKSYSITEPTSDQAGYILEPEWIQSGSNLGPQYRLGKDRLEEKKILSGKPDETSSQIVEIVSYLNSVTGKAYRHTTQATRKLIKARLNDGYSVDDFKAVIDCKHSKWGNDPKMCAYLRPETLFRPSHFESYLNEAKEVEANARKFSKYD